MNGCYVIPELRKLMAIDFYITYTVDGETEFMLFQEGQPVSTVFISAAKEVAFSDCTGVSDVVVHLGDKEFHYSGWQPGMVFEFVDDMGTVVFSGCFDSWEH